jgi:hypothetical protein
MASISSGSNGHRSVQFMATDGKRRTIRLGKLPMKAGPVSCPSISSLRAKA